MLTFPFLFQMYGENETFFTLTLEMKSFFFSDVGISGHPQWLGDWASWKEPNEDYRQVTFRGSHISTNVQHVCDDPGSHAAMKGMSYHITSSRRASGSRILSTLTFYTRWLLCSVHTCSKWPLFPPR